MYDINYKAAIYIVNRDWKRNKLNFMALKFTLFSNCWFYLLLLLLLLLKMNWLIIIKS
eukprot:UN06140